ncbi:MAG: hypothetical protein KDD70_11200, partial [Bdellovibrionales bacterium]|nr:hypothetical protein [Bdellovibrionales bacterium]
SGTDVAFGETTLEAVREFDKKAIASANGGHLDLSEDSSLTKVEAKVKRVQVWNESGNSTLRFTIESEEFGSIVFSAGMEAGNGVPLVRDGDTIRIQFRDIHEGTVPVTHLVFVDSPFKVAPMRPTDMHPTDSGR